MIRIILFLLLIALGAAGAAWVAEQTGDVVLSWGGWRVADHAAGVRAGARHRHRRGDAGVGDPARAVAHAGARCGTSRRERRQARGRHAITQGLLAIGHGDSAAARSHADAARRHAGARSAGAAAARAIGAARRRPRRRAARLPRHGRARGHAAARPARPVHRGAARRRSGRRRDGRRGSAEAVAVVVLGLACGARLLLRARATGPAR